MSERGFESRWGAHLRPDGSALFRLWAPAVDHLRLKLGRAAPREMQKLEQGWYELEVEGLSENAHYSFLLPNGMAVPDPAARAQASDVHGPSLLTGSAFQWKAADWRGRPWEEAVVYELHPGTFSPEGDFDGIRRRLDHLHDLGVTAIELMPVAQFSGNRGWGYDGVLLYCPHSAYGGLQGLKQLVDAAHERGLMMILDVVYNHFGPDGNYLNAYAPDFFDPERHTPWGPAIHFSEPAVRAFFVDNPLYWLEEFRFDGLRFDAIDQVQDESDVPILEEMASAVRQRFGDRHVHLMTEDERNIIKLHPRDKDNRPLLFTAEWNDDIHHAAHCIATAEAQGYYGAFSDDPVGRLARGLASGFVYQGEAYGPWEGEGRGVPSAGQPPTAFVDFLQNHDQIGNRAFGERLTSLSDGETLELLTAVLVLNPQVPLFFMGEEYGETRPFLFFTDFHGELAKAVREGRRQEFRAFRHFSGAQAARIPDPNARATFEASRLDWERMESEEGRRRLALIQRLLRIRRQEIVPLLASMKSMQGRSARLGQDAFLVTWSVVGELLSLYVNFGTEEVVSLLTAERSREVYESRAGIAGSLRQGRLPARSVAFLIGKDEGGGDAG